MQPKKKKKAAEPAPDASTPAADKKADAPKAAEAPAEAPKVHTHTHKAQNAHTHTHTHTHHTNIAPTHPQLRTQSLSRSLAPSLSRQTRAEAYGTRVMSE
jgi:hypothetical protein